jgi:hypothetical protein
MAKLFVSSLAGFLASPCIPRLWAIVLIADKATFFQADAYADGQLV